MSPIAPFGWRQERAPDINAANLEAAHAAAGAYADALVKPITPRPVALGEVEGAVTPNLNEGNIFELTVKGTTTLEKPVAWPAGYSEQLVMLKQKAEAHTVTFGAGVTLVGGPVNMEPNSLSVFNLISQDGGVTVYAVNAVEGKTGATGGVGPAAWTMIAPWEAGKAYVVGPPASIVSNAGSCFVCIAPVSGSTPPGEDAVHWSPVATRGATGAVGPGGPPGATGATKALGNVSGAIKLNLAQALFWTMTAVGNLTIEFENWPAGGSEPELYIFEDATGGRTITIPGVTWQNETPEFFTTANAVNIVPLSSPDGGATIYGIRGQRGATGATGGAGPTGPEGKTGEWTAVTGVSAKIEEAEANQTVRARAEGGGSVARLRGAYKVKVGEELKTTDAMFTLPAGTRPPVDIFRTVPCGASITAAPTVQKLKIKSNGEVFVISAAQTAGKLIDLDSVASWETT